MKSWLLVGVLAAAPALAQEKTEGSSSRLEDILSGKDEKKDDKGGGGGGDAGASSGASYSGGGGGGQTWSLHTGRTMGKGRTALGAAVGFPGLYGELVHGVAEQIDLGVRLGFNYGYEDWVGLITPGLKLQGVFRLKLLEQNRFNLGLWFRPGMFLYFPPYGWPVQFGLAFPVGLTAGIVATSALNISVGVDFPMFVAFGSSSWNVVLGAPGQGYFVFPILLGAGLEYFVTSNLMLTFNTRMGPSITGRFGAPFATFALQAQFGIGWKFGG